MRESLELGGCPNRREAKFDTARGKGVYNFADIVTNHAKSRGRRVRFNNAPQSRLSIQGHAVRLVKNHKLELRYVAVRHRISCNFALCKLLYFFAHNCNAAFVTSVQFQYSLSVKVRAKELFRQSEDSRCLSGSWRPVQQQVRHLSSLHALAQRRYYFQLVTHFFNFGWSTTEDVRSECPTSRLAVLAEETSAHSESF